MIAVTPLSRTSALIILAVAATGCGAQPAGGDLLQRVRAAGVIRVVQTQANPPWNFLENGKPAGYDVDVARELARRLGIPKVEFLASNFQGFIPGVQASRFDMVIAGQTITKEREKQVEFSRPYQVNGISVFVPAGSSISGVGDLGGKRIAVTAGTTQATFARETIPGADIKTYDNATLGLIDVSRGRADAALVSRFQGTFLSSKNGLAVKPVGPLLESEVNGISFAKGSKAFKHAVDTALDEMIRDGALSAISRKWLGGLDMAEELRRL